MLAKDKKHKKSGKGDKPAASKSGGGLKALVENPLVADVVAAALVATASALRDSNRARALASDAGDELGKLSKAGSERGHALWEMALQIGQRSIEALSSNDKGTAKTGAKKSAGKKKKKTETSRSGGAAR